MIPIVSLLYYSYITGKFLYDVHGFISMMNTLKPYLETLTSYEITLIKWIFRKVQRKWASSNQAPHLIMSSIPELPQLDLSTIEFFDLENNDLIKIS